MSVWDEKDIRFVGPPSKKLPPVATYYRNLVKQMMHLQEYGVKFKFLNSNCTCLSPWWQIPSHWATSPDPDSGPVSTGWQERETVEYCPLPETMSNACLFGTNERRLQKKKQPYKTKLNSILFNSTLRKYQTQAITNLYHTYTQMHLPTHTKSFHSNMIDYTAVKTLC